MFALSARKLLCLYIVAAFVAVVRHTYLFTDSAKPTSGGGGSMSGGLQASGLPGPRLGSNGQQPTHHSTVQPGSNYGSSSRFGTGFPGVQSGPFTPSVQQLPDDQSVKDQQERERQKALEQVKNFLNPQNKPPVKQAVNVQTKDMGDSLQNSGKVESPATNIKDKDSQN